MYFILLFQEIYKKGGRKFGILALGNLGFSPSMTVSGNAGSSIPEGTVLSQLHNAALSEVLKELNIQLEGFKYAKQDINITVAEILSNPEIFGRHRGIFLYSTLVKSMHILI